MSVTSLKSNGYSSHFFPIGKAPLPREHGAWVMLYAPVVIALLALHAFPTAKIFALLAAITGLFLVRNVFGLLVRKRGGSGSAFWFILYSALFLSGALPLLFTQQRYLFIYIGLTAVILFGLHTILLMVPGKRRLDRSEWGEILASGALALTGPAAAVAAQGEINRLAITLWAASTLYFTSGIFFVKMLLAAAKERGEIGREARLRLGSNCLIYHAFLGMLLCSGFFLLPLRTAVIALIAILPVEFRMLKGWMQLSRRPPPLRKVGRGETLYLLWFAAMLSIALSHP